MKILVDADACPVKEQVVKVAKEFSIPVIMFIDTSHILNDGYSKIVTVEKSRDSVDIALVNSIVKGDITVTQDYGVAALSLSKGAKSINQNGFIYTEENIDKLLFERHLSQKMRRAGGRTYGPHKRTIDDNIRFEDKLRKLIAEA